MFLFNVTVHTPMNQGASRVTKICYCPNLLLKGLCKVLCAFDEKLLPATKTQECLKMLEDGLRSLRLGEVTVVSNTQAG